jgi:phosphohistidine phosphatase SixA/8-oxo-dGTP pyrophosphatase MutT (NUDIX family)
MPNVIAAAGGVVWRMSRSGVRIAVIHRPRRDDWSLPKGKLLVQAGRTEPTIVAAHREVVEETGLDVAVQHRVGRVHYRIGSANKTVTYWAMRHLGGSFVPNAEADLMRWVTPENALALLSFPADRGVVDQFTAHPIADAAVLLVRHGKAGKRSTWKKDDRLRPLDAHGRRQADAIARVGALFVPRRVGAAPLERCEQTVGPLARSLKLKVTSAPRFADAQFERRPERTVDALAALSRSGVSAVASQGVTIPALLDYLCPQRSGHDSRKGSIWAVFFRDGQMIATDYYERPGSP